MEFVLCCFFGVHTACRLRAQRSTADRLYALNLYFLLIIPLTVLAFYLFCSIYMF